MIAKEIDEIKFFLILGRPRSGTTLLGLLFAAHSNVSMSIETYIITELYIRFRRVKEWDKKKVEKFYNFIFKLRRVKFIDIDKANLKKDFAKINNDVNIERLIKLTILNVKTIYKKDKIIYIGDKTPTYSIKKNYLNIFKKLFPDVKIIHIVRDYRDHYLSVLKVNFKMKNRSLVAYRWIYSYDIITQVFGIEKDKYYLLKHEDLVSNPELKLREMCDFLGIEFQASVLEFYKHKEIHLKNISQEIMNTFHSKLLKPITDKYNYGWKKTMNDDTIMLMDSVVGDYAEKIGYERKYKIKSNKFLLWYLKSFTNFILFLHILADSFPHKLRQASKQFIFIFSGLYSKTLKV